MYFTETMTSFHSFPKTILFGIQLKKIHNNFIGNGLQTPMVDQKFAKLCGRK